MPSPYGQRRTRGSQVNVNPLADTDQNQMINVGVRDTEKYNFTDASYGQNFADKTMQPSDATVLASFIGNAAKQTAQTMDQLTKIHTTAETQELDAAKAEMARLKEQGASDQELNTAWEAMGLKPGKYTAKQFHEYDAARQNKSDVEYSSDWNIQLQKELNALEENGATTSEILSFLESKAETMPERSESYFVSISSNYQRQVGAQLESDRKSMIMDETMKTIQSYTVLHGQATEESGLNLIPEEFSTPQQIEAYLLAEMQMAAIDDPAEWTDEYRIRIGAIRKAASQMAAARAGARGQADRASTKIQRDALAEGGHYTTDDITGIGMESAMQEERGLRPAIYTETLVKGMTGMATHGGDDISVNVARIDEMITLDAEQRAAFGLTDDEAYAEWQTVTKAQMTQALKSTDAARVQESLTNADTFDTPANDWLVKEIDILNGKVPSDTVSFVTADGDIGLVGRDGETLTDADAIKEELVEVFGEDAAQLYLDQITMLNGGARELRKNEARITERDKATSDAFRVIGDNRPATQNQADTVFEASTEWRFITGAITADSEEGMKLQQEFDAWAKANGIKNAKFDTNWTSPTPENRTTTQFMVDRMTRLWATRSNAPVPKPLADMMKGLLAQTNDPEALFTAAQIYQGLGAQKQRKLAELDGINLKEEFLLNGILMTTRRDANGLESYGDINKVIAAYQRMSDATANATTEQARRWMTQAFSKPADGQVEVFEGLTEWIDAKYGQSSEGWWSETSRENVREMFKNDNVMENILRQIEYVRTATGDSFEADADGDGEVSYREATNYVMTRFDQSDWTIAPTGEGQATFVYDPHGHTEMPAGHDQMARHKDIATSVKTMFTSNPSLMDLETTDDGSWNYEGMRESQRDLLVEIEQIPAGKRTQEQAIIYESMKSQYWNPTAQVKYSKAAETMATDLGFAADDPITIAFAKGEKTYGEVLREKIINDFVNLGEHDREYYEKHVPDPSTWEVILDQPGTPTFDDSMAAEHGGWPYRIKIPGMSELTQSSGLGDTFYVRGKDGRVATTWSNTRASRYTDFNDAAQRERDDRERRAREQREREKAEEADRARESTTWTPGADSYGRNRPAN